MSTALEQLRSNTREALRQSIEPNQPVALIDIPIHTNVGDLLIYDGACRYLQDLGVRLAYKADFQSFDARLLRQRMPKGTILVNGGGNFGDIWPHHQRLREQIARECPDYAIVQLPQSVYYRDDSQAERENRILADHGKFHLMVRETASLERARRLFPDIDVSLVPDMAIRCEPPKRPAPAIAWFPRTLVLARADQESVSGLVNIVDDRLQPNDLLTDWSMDRLENLEFRIGLKIRNQALRYKPHWWRRLLYPITSIGYELIRNANLRSGFRLFGSADIVLTDRLHAMILATMMGIPNIAMDNEYGKVSAIFTEYVGLLGETSFAPDAATLTDEWQHLRRAATKDV